MRFQLSQWAWPLLSRIIRFRIILFLGWVLCPFSLVGMSDSGSDTDHECIFMSESDIERNLKNLDQLAKVGQKNRDLLKLNLDFLRKNKSMQDLPRLAEDISQLKDKEIETSGPEQDKPEQDNPEHVAVGPDTEYIDYLQRKHDAIHKFLTVHARKGSSMRKQLDRALSESASSSSESGGRPRSLSKTQFDELLEIIGTASERLEAKHKKKKQEVKVLRGITVGATAFGSCAGATVASFCTALVAGILAVFLNVGTE